MQHSIAAKYAARPAARFVQPSMRARERRMGLVSRAGFHPAPHTATVLRDAPTSPLALLRAAGRCIQPAARRSSGSGRPAAIGAMHWTGGPARGARPTTGDAAPWRG